VDFDYFIREKEEWDWGHGESSFFRGTQMWAIREAQALALGQDLRAETNPDKYANPKPLEFFETLHRMGYDFSSTPVFVADSHAFAYPTFCSMAKKKDRFLLNFDAHHDLGYNVKKIKEHLKVQESDCGDWLLMTLMKCRKVKGYVVYPPWRGMEEWDDTFGKIKKQTEHGALYEKTIKTMATPFVWKPAVVKTFAKKVDCVFICRSGSWVPPWHDQLFVDFVESLTNITGGSALNVYTSHEKVDPLVPREYKWEEIKKMADQFKRLNEGYNGESKVAS
jgi:hypothetical protein